MTLSLQAKTGMGTRAARSGRPVSKALFDLVYDIRMAGLYDFDVIDSVGSPESSAREHEAFAEALRNIDAAVSRFQVAVAKSAYEYGAYEARVATHPAHTLDLFDDVIHACKDRASELREGE